MPAIFVAGVSHVSVPLDVRQHLAVADADLPAMLEAVRSATGSSEALILSTCNRVEVYGAGDPAGPDAARAAFDVLSRRHGADHAASRVEPILRTDGEAVRHCFRVAASLDSMIVGEGQIVGQVKAAYARAHECGTVGPVLHRLMNQALAVAKKVRTETALGRHAVSVPFAAVELARKIFGDLKGRSALLIGAGEMGELAARNLVEHGGVGLRVANRTWSRAQALATTLSATPIPFERWPEALIDVDVVVTSTGAPHPIVTAAIVRDALRRRGQRPLFFIDIAVPRDVEPEVDRLPAVYRYDVDDLRHVVDANRRERLREAERAERIAERAASSFLAALRTLEVAPTIASLHRRAEAVRQAEVAAALARLREASPETCQAIEAMSTALVNKIIHAPTAKLRASSEAGTGPQWARAVAELFALDGAPADASSRTRGARAPAPGELATASTS